MERASRHLNDGRFVFGAVYYSSEASVNVLCMSVVDRAHSVTYVNNFLK
jgi:hypothetical protein